MPELDPKSTLFPPYYRLHALRLHEQGYRVIPARPGTKRPAFRNWNQFSERAPSLEQVKRWSDSSNRYGVILLTGFYPDGVSYGAIDLDEDEPERAAQLLTLTLRIFGETPLRRIGRPNRRVLLYALSPRPTASRPLGPKVELIADRKCVVLYGIHPKTQQPYTWDGPSPEDVPAWDLP